jgi:hypothetical protein
MDIEKIAQDQTKQYHRRKAKIFYEAAVGELLERYTLEETIEIMRSYHDQVAEYYISDPHNPEYYK